MTVAAIESDTADVVRVAELDGLLDELVLFGDPGRAHEHPDDPGTHQNKGEYAREACAGERVGIAGENLTHTSSGAP